MRNPVYVTVNTGNNVYFKRDSYGVNPKRIESDFYMGDTILTKILKRHKYENQRINSRALNIP